MPLVPVTRYRSSVVGAPEPRSLASSGKENGGRSSERTDLCTGRNGKGTRDEPGARDQGVWRPEEEPSLQERLGGWPFRAYAVVHQELEPRGMGRSPGEALLLPGASRRAADPRDAGARGLRLIQGCGFPLGADAERRTRMNSRVTAQLHSSSGRSSKIIKDHTHIRTVVEVEGVGRLLLDVNSGGGYSLRAYAEGNEDPSRDLLAVGVVHADEIIAITPEGVSAVDGEQGAARPERSPTV